MIGFNSPFFFQGYYVSEREVTSYVRTYEFEPYEGIFRTRKSSLEIDAIFSELTSNVAGWVSAYGRYEATMTEDVYESDRTVYWKLEIAKRGNFSGIQSGGASLYPSDEDASLPSGPEQTSRFTKLVDIFNRNSPKIERN